MTTAHHATWPIEDSVRPAAVQTRLLSVCWDAGGDYPVANAPALVSEPQSPRLTSSRAQRAQARRLTCTDASNLYSILSTCSPCFRASSLCDHGGACFTKHGKQGIRPDSKQSRASPACQDFLTRCTTQVFEGSTSLSRAGVPLTQAFVHIWFGTGVSAAAMGQAPNDANYYVHQDLTRQPELCATCEALLLWPDPPPCHQLGACTCACLASCCHCAWRRKCGSSLHLWCKRSLEASFRGISPLDSTNILVSDTRLFCMKDDQVRGHCRCL